MKKAKKEQKFRIGDNFKFDIKSMKTNNINTTGADYKIHKVLQIELHPVLGELIIYKIIEGVPVAQCNAVWLKKV